MLSNDAGAVGWDIISEVWSDYRDASDPRSLDRIFREVGTQIHAETFEIPKTRKNTKYEIVADETQHQITALSGKTQTAARLCSAQLQAVSRRHRTSCMATRPKSPPCAAFARGRHNPERACQPQRVREQGTSVALTKADLDNLARHLWLDEQADYNKGNWWIVCHPLTHQYIHDFDISYRRMEKDDTGVGFYRGPL